MKKLVLLFLFLITTFIYGNISATFDNAVGLRHFYNGNYQAALDAFAEALKKNPNYDETYYNLARTYRKLGKVMEAIKAYKKAIQINPYNTSAKYELEDILKVQKEKSQLSIKSRSVVKREKNPLKVKKSDRLDKFSKEIDNIISQKDLKNKDISIINQEFTDDLDVLKQKVVNLKVDYPFDEKSDPFLIFQKGNLEESLDQFTKYINNEKGKLEHLYYDYGMMYFEIGLYSRASEMFNKSLVYNKDIYQTHYMLGIIAQKKDEIEKGIKHFEASLLLRPYFNLGKYRLLISKKEKVLQYYRKGKDLFESQDFGKAIEMFQKAIQDKIIDKKYYVYSIDYINKSKSIFEKEQRHKEVVLESNINRNITFAEVDENRDINKGKVIKWSGEVFKVVNFEKSTHIYINSVFEATSRNDFSKIYIAKCNERIGSDVKVEDIIEVTGVISEYKKLDDGFRYNNYTDIIHIDSKRIVVVDDSSKYIKNFK